VTIQALGWKKGGLFSPLNCEMSSVAFWYQKEPHQKFPTLPAAEEIDWHPAK